MFGKLTSQFPSRKNKAARRSAPVSKRVVGFRPGMEELEDRRVLSSLGLADWGTSFFAPYVNVQQAMSNGSKLDYAQAAQAGNTKFLTLGFVDADSNGKASWQGDVGSELGSSTLDDQIQTQVDNVRAQVSGDVMISFGGEDDGSGQSTELARYVSSTMGTGTAALNQLVADYQQVITEYHLTHIDFDIEGDAESDTASIDLRSKALAQLQQDNPGLQVHFTLTGRAPEDANLVFGMTTGAQAIVNSALDAGVSIAGVNLMTMDFSNYVNYFDDTPANRNFYQTQHNPGGFSYAGDDLNEDGIHNVADVVIRNANAELTQLAGFLSAHGVVKTDAEVRAMIGVTPEIGRNYTNESSQGQAGDSNVIFSLEDAQTVTDFATAQGFGRISMWSLGRDQTGDPTNLTHSETNSSLVQTPYAFSQIFSAFDSGAVTTPDTTGPHITSAVFSGSVANTFEALVVTFSETIDQASFGAADVVITGPTGSVIPTTGVTLDTGTNGTRFSIAFAPQTAPGTYSVTIGPDVSDMSGNPMDQNQDGSNGDLPADKFTGTQTLGTQAVPPIFAVGASDGSIRILNASTGATIVSDFRPLDVAGSQYTGLVEVAVGDLNGDGVADVFVAAAGPLGVAGLEASKAGRVFVYDGATLSAGTKPGSAFHEFTPFATTDGPGGTAGAYINGLNIAVGDVNGDGSVDLIAGTRGGNGISGQNEYGRLVVIDGSGSDAVIGGIQKPFGPGYQKGVVVAAGNADGIGGDEIAVTRGGPVASANPAVQRIKVKVLQLQTGSLTELPLSADGSTSFAPFASLSGPARAINRDGRVAFVDTDGDGKAELVFSALDPITDLLNERVRVGVYSINVNAGAAAATIISTGADAGTYVTGNGVVDHAITHVAGTGTQQNLALITENGSSGIAYLAPLTGAVQAGGFALSILHGGVTIDGV